MSSILRRIRAPTLDNTGSTARDHLASERTFLAWIRTGLGFIALGMAVERFSRLDLEALLDRISPHPPLTTSSPLRSSSTSKGSTSTPGTPDSDPSEGTGTSAFDSALSGREHVLVGTLLGTGGGSITYAITRYFSNHNLLQRGKFRPAYLGAAGLGLAVMTLGGGIYWSAVEREWKKAKGSRRSS